MKIKHSSSISLLVVISFIISSCAVNHEVEKKLVGKWNPVNAENLTPQAPVATTTQYVVHDTSTTGTPKKDTTITLPVPSAGKAAKIERAMANEMNSPVLISIADNQRTLEKYYPGKTVKGTWKLKKNGKRLAVKITETGKNYTLDIVSLTDSTTVVIEKLPVGDLQIKYAKVK
jgi:hypothetical protein